MNSMFIVQFLIVSAVLTGVIIFVLKKVLFDSTQGAVNRLNKETEDVRNQQKELAEKIKQANEELSKRQKEADALVAKMTEEAEEKAKEEREKLVNKARSESDEILQKAQRSKEDMRMVIEKEMEMKIVDFTAEILNSVFAKKSIEALQEALVSEFLDKLDKTSMEIVTQEVAAAEVVVAADVPDQLKQRISSILKEKLNREVKVEYKVAPEIVGGAILKLGSLALNGSLKNLLEEEAIAIKEKIEKS